jgi:hypothetical protein
MLQWATRCENTFLGVRSPWDRIRDVVLTARVPVGPNTLWRSPPLLGRAYLMLELSWQLCVLLWWSSNVRRRRDKFPHSSAYCQALVGVWLRPVVPGI